MKQSRTRKPGRPAGAHSGEGRAALLKAAQELMAEQGLPRVTLREVAERAGVQPGLVNYYFGSKQGLLQAVVREVAAEMLARIQAAAAGSGTPDDRVREFIHGMVEANTAAPYAPRLFMEQVLFGESEVVEEFVESFARPNLTAMMEVMRDGMDSGRFREIDPKFILPAMTGACGFFFLGAAVMRHVYDIESIDTEIAREFAESTAELILHGLVNHEVSS